VEHITFTLPKVNQQKPHQLEGSHPTFDSLLHEASL